MTDKQTLDREDPTTSSSQDTCWKSGSKTEHGRGAPSWGGGRWRTTARASRDRHRRSDLGWRLQWSCSPAVR